MLDHGAPDISEMLEAVKKCPGETGPCASAADKYNQDKAKFISVVDGMVKNGELSRDDLATINYELWQSMSQSEEIRKSPLWIQYAEMSYWSNGPVDKVIDTSLVEHEARAAGLSPAQVKDAAESYKQEAMWATLVGIALTDGGRGGKLPGGKTPGKSSTPSSTKPSSETYFRVEGGGSGTQTSQNRINVNSDGSVTINSGCSGQLCVSTNGSNHAAYYLTNRRQDGTVVVFEVDAKLHKQIMDAAVPQKPVPGVPTDPNAPKVVDPTKGQPSVSLELPKVWDKLIEKNSSNARILTKEEFLNEFRK